MLPDEIQAQEQRKQAELALKGRKGKIGCTCQRSNKVKYS